MAEYFEPFVEIKLEILLQRRAQEASSPATPASVRHWSADRASRREEEKVDVRIHLADDAEVDVEMEVQALERDVGFKRTVFPLMPEAVRF